MAFIEWSNRYSVKVRKFDEAHQGLVDLMNELHTAMSTGKGMQVIRSILVKLREYTENHFTDEEQEMEKHGYPEIVSHKQYHGQFVDQLKKFEEEASRGKMLLSLEVMTFLKNWLIHHIAEVDKQYSNYFNEKGIS